MSNLFIQMFNLSLTAGWIVLAVLLLRPFLRRVPKWIPCLLWGVVGLRLLFPFSLESVWSLIPSAEPLPQDITVTQTPVIDSGFAAVDQVINPVISESLAPSVEQSVNPMQVVVGVAANVWVVGIALMLLYALFSYLRLAHKVRPSVRCRENIYYCDNIDTPFILGVFRPRIYLPSGMREEQMDYVIQHEKAHLKRGDHIWKPLGFVLLAVYWFHPLLWIAYVLLCRDIETACDEKVIKDMDNAAKKGYAETLVDCSIHRRMILVCPLAFGEVSVKNRVKKVLHYKKPTVWIIVVALIASIVVAVCFLTNPKQDAKESVESETESTEETTDESTPGDTDVLDDSSAYADQVLMVKTVSGGRNTVHWAHRNFYDVKLSEDISLGMIWQKCAISFSITEIGPEEIKIAFTTNYEYQSGKFAEETQQIVLKKGEEKQLVAEESSSYRQYYFSIVDRSQSQRGMDNTPFDDLVYVFESKLYGTVEVDITAMGSDIPGIRVELANVNGFSIDVLWINESDVTYVAPNYYYLYCLEGNALGKPLAAVFTGMLGSVPANSQVVRRYDPASFDVIKYGSGYYRIEENGVWIDYRITIHSKLVASSGILKEPLHYSVSSKSFGDFDIYVTDMKCLQPGATLQFNGVRSGEEDAPTYVYFDLLVKNQTSNSLVLSGDYRICCLNGMRWTDVWGSDEQSIWEVSGDSELLKSYSIPPLTNLKEGYYFLSDGIVQIKFRVVRSS